MSDLVRFSVSIEKVLYDQLESLVTESQYSNRSEFVRDLIREKLVQEEWKSGEEAIGTITLVYNHHQRKVGERLTDVQHHHHRQILAVTHVHLDHDLCVEAILVKAPAEEIRHLANELKSQIGVVHAGLTMSTTGKQIS